MTRSHNFRLSCTFAPTMGLLYFTIEYLELSWCMTLTGLEKDWAKCKTRFNMFAPGPNHCGYVEYSTSIM